MPLKEILNDNVEHKCQSCSEKIQRKCHCYMCNAFKVRWGEHTVAALYVLPYVCIYVLTFSGFGVAMEIIAKNIGK